MDDFRRYKDKIGELGQQYVQHAAKNMQPTKFYESYGSSIPHLSFMAKKIFGISLANECAELDWNHFKKNRTKDRSQLSTEKVHKLITVQCAQTLKEKLYLPHKNEYAKWTEADELCELSKSTTRSTTTVSVDFKNFVENWEQESINTKNNAHEELLRRKYM